MNLNKFNISHIKLCTKLEGPYKRCCIWFQGCNINCKDCCNKDLQPLVPKNIVTIEELVNIIKDAKDKFNIEGVTLSGGEPSLQRGLKDLNDEIHNLGLGVIMFSGKYIDNLDCELVSSVDLLIDGPFISNQIDEDRILIGSKNKNLHFITDRYKDQENYFYDNISKEEVVIDDYIFINGN